MFKSLLTNHPLVNILFTVVLVMGAISFWEMPREQDPEINFNWIDITTILPGATAADVEAIDIAQYTTEAEPAWHTQAVKILHPSQTDQAPASSSRPDSLLSSTSNPLRQASTGALW